MTNNPFVPYQQAQNCNLLAERNDGTKVHPEEGSEVDDGIESDLDVGNNAGNNGTNRGTDVGNDVNDNVNNGDRDVDNEAEDNLEVGGDDEEDV